MDKDAMITVEQARQLLLRSVATDNTSNEGVGKSSGFKAIEGNEVVALRAGLGRVLAEDVISTINVPPQDNSAMDGFALRAKEAKVGSTLEVSQRIAAGHSPDSLLASSAARIFTGGVIPKGADAVIIQENCNYDESTALVTPLTEVARGDNIRRCGQDISLGAVVARRGRKLNAVDIALIASVGQAEVCVYKRLKVAIFSTGDELIEPLRIDASRGGIGQGRTGQELQIGQIYNSNRVMLEILCKQLGFDVIDCGIVEDTLEASKHALKEASLKSDIVISSGGVSVGEEDHIKPAVEALGRLSLWKVQMKPGKPVAFGDIDGVPFLGLPGNPVSSYVVFQLLAVPMLECLQHQTARLPAVHQVSSAFNKAAVSREEYIRAKLVRDQDWALSVDRFGNLSSGVLSSLAWADGLVRQKVGRAIVEGESVDFLPLTNGLL